MTDQKSKQKISTVVGRTGDTGKAVVERVFRAHTDPKIISQWWSPRCFTTTIEKMDVKPGGIAAKWRILVTNYHHSQYYSDTLE